MTKFATVDANGVPTGFYSTEIHGTDIPIDAIEITDIMWRELLQYPGQRKIVVDGETVTVEEYVSVPTKEQLHEYVNRVRDAHEQGGFVYNGWRFDSDAISVTRINGASLAAQAAIAAGTPFEITWTDADNVSRTLDAAGMLALHMALVQHANACHVLGRALKDQVANETITSYAEIDAADWPPNTVEE